MPKQKGKTHDLTFTIQRIDEAVSGLNGACFNSKEIHEISGIDKHVVHVILVEKTNKGLLQRIGRGCYKGIPGRNLAIKRPSAFVATKVWEVLCNSDKPLTNREISEILEKESGFNFYFYIGNLLSSWYRGKSIDKLGGKRPYEYQIKPDYKGKNRPVVRH